MFTVDLKQQCNNNNKAYNDNIFWNNFTPEFRYSDLNTDQNQTTEQSSFQNTHPNYFPSTIFFPKHIILTIFGKYANFFVLEWQCNFKVCKKKKKRVQ